MRWWPFGRNSREPRDCECEENGCEATEEYLASLPACIRNNKERLRRARKLDRLEEQGHKLFDSQILQLREIRARLVKDEK